MPKRDLFWGYSGRKAIRQGDWKLILRNKEAEPLLYNLKEDIAETNNLASEHQELVNSLLKKMEAWSDDVYVSSKK